MIQLASMYYLINTQKPPMYSNILFLFDEVDAFLHHNFCKNIVEMFNNISKDTLNVQIILTTHNYSTINSSPPQSLFYVKEGKINKIDKETAIYEITDSELDITSPVKKYNLLVEGKTDKTIIEQAIEKLGYSDKLKGLNIKSADGAKSIGPLINLYYQRESSNLFIGLYDCDKEGIAQEKGFKIEDKSLWCKKMHLKVANGDEQKLFENRENLSTEYMFSKKKLQEVLKNNEFRKEDSDYIDIGRFEESCINYSPFSANNLKTTFAEATKDFTKQDFENFQPILDEIVNHIKDFEKALKKDNQQT